MRKNFYIIKIGMLLFPPRCPVCDRVLEQDILLLMRDQAGERMQESENGRIVPVLPGYRNGRGHNPWICPDCRGKFTKIGEPVCAKCGKPLYDAQQEYCTDCLRHAHVFKQNRALWEYNGEVRKLLHRLKYENRSDLAQAIGWELAGQFEGFIKIKQIEAVIPVPLHNKKQKMRGFNQAEAIAGALAARMGLPLVTGWLTRSRYTQPQKNLTAVERKNNLENAFQLTENIVKLKKVLLVDDIYTTGSTLDAAAGALTDGGIREVYCICVGIGRSG